MTDEQFFSELNKKHDRIWPQGVAKEATYPHGQITLGSYLEKWAEQQPSVPAVIYYGAHLTYHQLNQDVNRCANLLADMGVTQGTPVALMLGNCPQFHIVFYALMKLGAIYVPINPLFKEQELIYELNDAGAKILIVQDSLYSLVEQVKNEVALTSVLTTALGDLLPVTPSLVLPAGLDSSNLFANTSSDLLTRMNDYATDFVSRDVDLNAVAALNYTGGTTGMPKGCVHTQGDMIYTAASALAVGSIGEENKNDVMLNFLPMFWIAGENLGLIFPIFSGSTLVLLNRWDAQGVLEAVQIYRVKRTFMVVDNVVEILQRDDLSQYDLSSLVNTRVASFIRKLTIDIRDQWQKLTGSIIAEGAWGMTETHTSDTFTTGMQTDNLDLSGRPIFVGLPVPGTRVKICSFETGETLAIGEEGEMVVQSPSMLKAYWNKPEATEESLRDGWFHTGDLGAYDEDGYLHFLGRRKEMLKVRGMSVFPSELEVLLARHPAVLGSAVIGREDPDKGQVPVAFIKLKNDYLGQCSAQDIESWCRENMATYKVPEIKLLQDLPMTATGKVRKVELQELV